MQSKIKDHVAYFKAMAKDSSNRPMFNKDPIIYAKDPNGEEDVVERMPQRKTKTNKNPSLRVRESGEK